MIERKSDPLVASSWTSLHRIVLWKILLLNCPFIHLLNDQLIVILTMDDVGLRGRPVGWLASCLSSRFGSIDDAMTYYPIKHIIISTDCVRLVMRLVSCRDQVSSSRLSLHDTSSTDNSLPRFHHHEIPCLSIPLKVVAVHFTYSPIQSKFSSAQLSMNQPVCDAWQLPSRCVTTRRCVLE